jgi:hypothetical protein
MEEGWMEMSRLSEYMLDKSVTQQRKASDTGNSVEAWGTVQTGLAMAIYPASNFSISMFQSPLPSVKLSHNGYCYTADATFQVGDRIIEGTVTYAVLGMKIWDDFYEVNMGIVKW